MLVMAVFWASEKNVYSRLNAVFSTFYTAIGSVMFNSYIPFYMLLGIPVFL